MDAARQPKLEAKNVRLAYYNERMKRRLQVLDGIDLKLFEGELVAIVGPSGCGKSTFLNAVDGLTKLNSGEIRVDGKLVSAPGPDRAMVFQQDSLFPWYTVRRNVMYGLELQNRLGQDERLDRADALIELVGLTGFADHYPHELSGGMRQRVNIARALAPEPQLLLLDEPFAALDAQTREFMQVELMKILARARKTALFITHQIDEAIFLADRVVVFSARPARIKEIVAVDLPANRALDVKLQRRFRELYNHVWQLIQEEIRALGICSRRRRNRVTVTPADDLAAPDDTTADAPPNRLLWKRNENLILGLVSVSAFLLFWEFSVRLGWVNPLFTSSPTRIFATGFEMFRDGSIYPDLWVSTQEFVLGYGLAVIMGVPLGILMGWYSRLNALLDPFVSALYATPRIALMPLIIIWFGIDMSAKIAIIFLSTVFPIIISTMTGVRTMERDYVKVARSFGASDRQLFATVALPSSVPHILTGLRLGLGHALIGIVVGEMYGASAGIGYMMQTAGATFQTDKVMVGILIIAGAGMALTQVLKMIEKRFDAWRPDHHA